MNKRATKPLKKSIGKKPKGSRPAKKKVKSAELPARHRAGQPAPHTGRPVRNCGCICCVAHRTLNREVLRDVALAVVHDDVFGSGPVRFGESATEALRAALE